MQKISFNWLFLSALFLYPALVCAEYEKEIASLQLNAQHRANTYIQELKDSSKTQEPIAVHLKKVSQVLVFLSFSMPEKSLKAWLLQCKRSGATPVIRGLIHNSFRQTLMAIQNLSKKTGIGMQLDPMLFKTFAIKVVPAVVYIKELPQCPSNMNCKTIEYDILYGNVSLNYALEKIKSAQSFDDPNLQQWILRLRGEPIG